MLWIRETFKESCAVRLLIGVLLISIVMLSAPGAFVHADEDPSLVIQTENSDPGEGGGGEQGSQGEEGEQGGAGEEGEEGEQEAAPPEDGEETSMGEQGADGEHGDGSEEGAGGESTGDGEPGNDAGGSEGDDDPTTITTGDAHAEGEVQNIVNTNDTTVNTDGGTETSQGLNTTSATSTGTSGATATSTGETEIDIDEEDDGLEIEIENDNQATTTSELGIEAQTGDNTASTTERALIDTGNATAFANVVNVVNTNIVNSNGFLLLLNAIFGGGSFDLRNLNIDWYTPSSTGYQSLSGGGGESCSLSFCEDSTVRLEVENSNTAHIKNDVVVRSGTGGNTASAGGGGAFVSTGNAYAGANIFNVANTNIIDSNYLLVSINNFGDFGGDIVFPGMDFFSQFLTSGAGALTSGELDIENDNAATTTTNAVVDANSGDNMATSTEGAPTVDTGKAKAGATVVNNVNQNLLGGSSLMILLRVHGTWSGNVFGLPPGISWAETPDGIQLYAEGTGSGAGVTSGGGAKYKSLEVENDNKAEIENNVEVYALTGKNKVSASGDATVATGDAYAGANVVNVANTNVVGRNWILAIFNIFGDWSGNISFGRPDLWIGGRAESSDSPIRPGSEVTYHFTITNFGDSPANSVALKTAFDAALLSFESFDEELGGWSLGTLNPGESTEVSYRGRVSSSLAPGETPISLSAEAVSLENDNNRDDNTEELAIVAVRDVETSRGGGGSGSESSARVTRTGAGNFDNAELTVEKFASVSTTTAGTAVDYTITIVNNGGYAYESILHDRLTGPKGETVNYQQWNLETIKPGEEITVTYTVEFDPATASGIYTNEAYVTAIDNRPYANHDDRNANSDAVSVSVTVIGSVIAQECTAHITSYIKPGAENNVADVERLQIFLSEQEGFNLNVTGVYDVATESAVRVFQERYRAQILDPWGVSVPTGNVYYTTQKMINDLNCGGDSTFALTDGQLAEIEAYRLLRAGSPSVPSTEVGALPAEPSFTRRDKPEPQVFEGETQVGAAGSSVPQESIQELFKRLRGSVRGIFPWLGKFDLDDILSLR